jgi:hypothetical protein
MHGQSAMMAIQAIQVLQMDVPVQGQWQPCHQEVQGQYSLTGTRMAEVDLHEVESSEAAEIWAEVDLQQEAWVV